MMRVRVTGVALILAHAACTPSPRVSDPAPPPSDSVGLRLSWTQARCAEPRDDSDLDGLDDRCEFELARAFAPLLTVATGGCNWDPDARPARLGGAYLYAVQRVGGAYRVAYLPAYFRDCGWRGPKCLLPLVDCAPHAGDSEAIVVELAFSAPDDRWRTRGVFLSAHCFGRHAGSCRWYRGEALEQFAWVDGRRYGAPVVWVAEGRQANYPTKQACDRGHFRLDTCDWNDARYRFPVHSPAYDLGSRARPIGGDGCLESEALPAAGRGARAGAVECFWSVGRTFGGWQGAETGAGVTGYARYLLEVAGF